jgi:type VI secretion system secreted protein VgrG
VRCAQSWASAGFGAFHLPRVGDEVLVTYLDGDPDRPLVTGRVYNGLNAYPYPLPGERNRSGVKSQTVGGSGFNEVSYDDTAGEEELFLHAQRDLKNVVKNDHTRSVGNDETVSVGNNRTLEVGNILNEFVEALALINVKEGQASLSLDKDGNGLLNTTTELTTSVGTAASTKMASGGTVTVEANSEITLKVGGSSVTLTPSGITLEASKVEIKAPNIETSGSTLKNEHTSVDLTGSGSVKITGGTVDING